VEKPKWNPIIPYICQPWINPKQTLKRWLHDKPLGGTSGLGVFLALKLANLKDSPINWQIDIDLLGSYKIHLDVGQLASFRKYQTTTVLILSVVWCQGSAVSFHYFRSRIPTEFHATFYVFAGQTTSQNVRNLPIGQWGYGSKNPWLFGSKTPGLSKPGSPSLRYRLRAEATPNHHQSWHKKAGMVSRVEHKVVWNYQWGVDVSCWMRIAYVTVSGNVQLQGL